MILRYLLLLTGVWLSCSSHVFAQALPLDIVPPGEFYYLNNWSLKGHVKSLKVHRFQPRNPGDRFSTFEACRGDISARHKYHEVDDVYLFNRKGQLIKRTLATTTGKETTLYEYNFFDKISVIQHPTGQIRFTYDADGHLTNRSNYEGVKLVSSTSLQYVGDTVLKVTEYMLTGRLDTIKDVFDHNGRLIFSASKSQDYSWKFEHFAYDSLGRMTKHWNSNQLYFEYEYDEKNRVVKTYVGKDKTFLSISSYDDLNGICRTSRCEKLTDHYIERNYDCLCTAIDGQNNPIRREFIDCSKSGDEVTFGMNGFLEVEYTYFK